MYGNQLAGSCGAVGPNRLAWRVPVHLFAGRGGFQRRSPTGGSAYCTPRNATSFSCELKYIPSSTPASNITVGAGDVAHANASPKSMQANTRIRAANQRLKNA